MPVEEQSAWRRLRHNKGAMAVMAFFGLASLAAVPAYYRINHAPKYDYTKPLPKGSNMRGAYMNTTARDVGPDRPVARDDV